MSRALNFMLSHLTELVRTVIGVVIGELAVYNFLRTREKPTLTILLFVYT